jgi:hypothetical protein
MVEGFWDAVDGNGQLYWACLWVAVGALFLFILLRDRLSKFFLPESVGNGVFLSLIALVVVAGTWPLVLVNFELGPDESQALAQASRLSWPWVPWRDLDGFTTGPLYPLPLWVLRTMQIPMGYITAHILTTLFFLAFLAFTFATVKRAYGSNIASWSLVPLTLFFCLSSNGDIHHYSSEIVPILLLAAATWMATLEISFRGLRRKIWPLSGIPLGAVAFGKMQAAPLALGLAIFICSRQFPKTNERESRVFRRRLFYFAFALFLPTFLILIPVIVGGAWEDFWNSYIKLNFGYRHPVSEKVSFLTMIAKVPFYKIFFGTSVGLIGTALLLSRVRGGGEFRPQRSTWISLVSYFLLSIYVSWLPGSGWAHYLLLTFHPILLLTGHSLSILKGVLRDLPGKQKKFWVALIPFFLILGPLLGVYFKVEENPYVGQSRYFYQARNTPELNILSRYTHSGKSVALWGWAAYLWVGTQTIPATRYGNGHFLFVKELVSSFHRKRYLEDFQAQNPELFVDVAESGTITSFLGLTPQSHESFPELARIIHDEYALADSSYEGRLRIYRRKKTSNADFSSGPVVENPAQTF